MSVIQVLTFRHKLKYKMSLAFRVTSCWLWMAIQSLPPITSREIRIKIFCEINHNNETNTQL